METLWKIVVALHLLAMAFFVGGQLVLAAALVPVERRAPDRERMRAVARRFGYGSVVAFVVSFATGAALASHLHDWSRQALQIKLVLAAVVVLLVGWHMRRPSNHLIDAAILICSLAMVYLGVRLAG